MELELECANHSVSPKAAAISAKVGTGDSSTSNTKHETFSTLAPARASPLNTAGLHIGRLDLGSSFGARRVLSASHSCSHVRVTRVPWVLLSEANWVISMRPR